MTALLIEGAAVAAAPARPQLVTRDVLTAQWERLAHWFGREEFGRDATWTAADALAPRLSHEDVTFWFEELVRAKKDQHKLLTFTHDYGEFDDPDDVERDVLARLDEAVEHLIGGGVR